VQNLAASEIVGCSELILICGIVSFCSGRIIILSISLYVCLLTFADEVWISLVVLLLEISCSSLQSDVSPFPVSRAEAFPTQQICFCFASLPSLSVIFLCIHGFVLLYGLLLFNGPFCHFSYWVVLFYSSVAQKL